MVQAQLLAISVLFMPLFWTEARDTAIRASKAMCEVALAAIILWWLSQPFAQLFQPGKPGHI